MDPRAFMLTSSARSRLDLEHAGRAAADKAAAVPSYAAQTGGLRRATLTRRSHAGLPELGQARSGRMPDAQFAPDGPCSRPSKTRPSWEQLLASPASSAKRPSGVFAGSGPPIPGHVAIVPVCASASPPVSRDHGLRLRLKSAASSRLPLESLLPGKP